MSGTDGLIEQLGDSLVMAMENMQEAADLFEDKRNTEAWEWVASAQVYTKAALAAYRIHKES